MNNSKVRYITRTAMLLALTIAFQIFGRAVIPAYSNLIVGPLVNACLLISTGLIGIYSGTVIAILSPFVALFTGATIPLPLLFFVALGNFVLVFVFNIFKKKRAVGIIIGAVAKYLIIYGSLILIIPYFKVPAAQITKLASNAFGSMQLITALIGGIIALPVIYRLEKLVK
jgi:hypothetical protein